MWPYDGGGEGYRGQVYSRSSARKRRNRSARRTAGHKQAQWGRRKRHGGWPSWQLYNVPSIASTNNFNVVFFPCFSPRAVNEQIFWTQATAKSAKMGEVREYMAVRKLPKMLQLRIRKHFEYVYGNMSVFREVSMNRMTFRYMPRSPFLIYVWVCEIQ